MTKNQAECCPRDPNGRTLEGVFAGTSPASQAARLAFQRAHRLVDGDPNSIHVPGHVHSNNQAGTARSVAGRVNPATLR